MTRERGEHAVPVLRVRDLAASVPFYRRLGFELEWEHRYGPDFPLFGSIRCGGWHVFLSEHTGDAPPGGLVCFVAGDVDALQERWRAAGVDAPPPEDRPWGVRELWLTDPDGNRLRFGAAGR